MNEDWCCRDCGFHSKTRKGCMIHITKKHTVCDTDTMDISSRCRIGPGCQPIAVFARDCHRYDPLLCRRRKRSMEPFQRPAKHEGPSTNGARRNDSNEADCGISQSGTSKANDEDQTNPCSSRERVDSVNSSVGDFGSCSTNPGPFPCGFPRPESVFNLSKLGMVSPILDESDLLPEFGCHAEGACDGQGSSRRFQTTVESQTRYRRIIRTKRSKERPCRATSECTAHRNDPERSPPTDFGINSKCGSPSSDTTLLSKLWPIRLSESLALPRGLDLSGRSVTEIKICTIFMKLLGDCAALDFLPANKWDIVVRCSICGKPLGGMQNIEDHVKDHLELVGHECSICELPRMASDDVSHHHGSCCEEDDDHEPTSTPTDIPAPESP